MDNPAISPTYGDASRLSERAPDPPGLLGILRKAIPIIEWLYGKCSIHGNNPWYEPAIFSWTAEIERSAPDIQREADALLAANRPIPGLEVLSAEQRVLSTDGKWKMFFFLTYGVAVERNCALCPATVAAVRRIPGIITACYAILDPGKELPLHYGPYKGVLRYQLGVRVPRDWRNCAITVAGETRPWREGESLMFDDTFLHAAYNRTDQPRLVLFVDFVRPMYFPANLLNRLFLALVKHSGYFREAKRRLEAWEAAHVPAPGDATG